MAVCFKHIDSPDQAADYVFKKLNSRLGSGQKLLWLVAGGSAGEIALRVARQLKDHPALSRLSLSLTDERYGKPGHKDSNWTQLINQGLKLNGARLVPVLNGQDLKANARHYESLLNKELGRADYSIALAGLGPDGHIFGIKPASPALNDRLDVSGYHGADYDRLTPTIRLIKRINQVIIYALGAEKWPQFAKLSQAVSPAEQPAQLLKQLDDVTILSDYLKGGVAK